MRAPILPPRINTVIASFGGVGTTSLLTHLANHTSCNDPLDADGLKHTPLPPMTLRKDVRFVYLFGEPLLAVVSLFRRNFQHGHSRKLQRYQSDAVGPIPPKQSLSDYAAEGVERFGLERHFENWYATFQVHHTLFIRYEALHDHLDTLADFLELPHTVFDTFPPHTPRQSTLTGLSLETQDGLKHLYGAFAARLEGLDDVVIKGRASAKEMRACYHSDAYWHNIKHNFRETKKNAQVKNERS